MQNKFALCFPVLHTTRLTLRKLTIDDEEAIFNLRSDNEVNKYLDRESAESIDDAKTFINKIIENSSKHNSFYWAISLTDSNKLIGTICLYGFPDDGDKCEIGFELLPNFQGRGIMGEALEKVIDFAFNTIKVQKLEAVFHRDNQKSKKLLERFSFENSKENDKGDPALMFYCLDSTLKSASDTT